MEIYTHRDKNIFYFIIFKLPYASNFTLRFYLACNIFGNIVFNDSLKLCSLNIMQFRIFQFLQSTHYIKIRNFPHRQYNAFTYVFFNIPALLRYNSHTKKKLYPLKGYNSLIISMFTELCNHCYLISGHFNHLPKSLILINHHTSSFSPQNLAIPI